MFSSKWKDRWETRQGKRLKKKVLQAICYDKDWRALSAKLQDSDVDPELCDLRGLSIESSDIADILKVSRLELDDMGLRSMTFEKVLFDYSRNWRLNLEDCRFENCSFVHADWHTYFSSVVLKKCAMENSRWGSSWKRGSLEDCDFNLATISVATMQGVVFNRVSIAHGKLSVMDIGDWGEEDNSRTEEDSTDESERGFSLPTDEKFNEELKSIFEESFGDRFSTPQNAAEFYDCDLRGCSLKDSALNGFRFIRCNFDDADLRNTKLRNAYFERCSFEKAEFYGSQRDGSDFRNSKCGVIDYSSKGDGSQLRYFSDGEFDRVITFLGSPGKEEMPRIFLCHSSHDKGTVEKFAHELSNKGIGVWFDKWEIRVGDSIIERIEEGIGTSKYMLIFLSQASLASEWVKTELKAGLIRDIEDHGIRIMPILLEECEVPILLRERKYYRLGSHFEDCVNEILRSVTLG